MPTSPAAQVIPAESNLQQRVLTEQVMLLCRLSREAMAGGIFAALFVCFVLWRERSAYQVATWFVLIVVVSALRGVFQQRILDGHTAIDRRTLAWLRSGILAHGLVWSLPGTWLMPMLPSNQVILALFMVGLSATTMSSLSSLKYAYTSFIGGMMMPIAVYYFYLGGDSATSAIGVVAYLVFMIFGVQRQTRGTEALLRLQFENAELADNVRREKEVVERSNRDLQLEIEQRERTEAALRVSTSEAQTASRAKSQFLANMSHELRTPLNGIMGMSELLLRSLPQPGQLAKHLKYAQTVHSAGERLLHLINDILDMARIEAGALRLEHHSFSARELVAEVVDLTVKQCNDKGLTLSVNVSPQVPAMLRGDANRLRQVLLNLVANAIKFTQRGGVEVRVERAASQVQEGNCVALRWSVTDTGIGIADLARAQLFRPFSQVDDSATREFGGSGLGLAICQQLVQAMGGRIDVQSTTGHGSTFWFELGFDIPVGTQGAEPAAAAPVGTALGGRILVAEDNLTNAQLLVEMLELAGCQASTARNGREALSQLSQHHFDLVLMDWHMPEMDGVTATREWREHERGQAHRPHVPIVALTASVLPGDRDTCLKAGMDDFLGKPFTYDELFAVVQRWVPSGTVLND